MKVAILTPTFNHFSGIDRVVQLQAEEFVRKGHEVMVVALEAKIRPRRYKVVSLGMPRSPLRQRLYRLFFFLDRKAMSRYKLLSGCDKVISHFYPMNWLAWKAKKEYGFEYVYWDHGINTTGLIESLPQKVYMRLFLWLNNITLRNADKAFSVSKYLSRQLLKESGIKSQVVYNTVDKRRFNRSVKLGDVVNKHRLKGKTVFLYVGRLSPHKGIHLLIKAFMKVQKALPDSKLVIVGKPTFKGYSHRLRRLAGKDVVFAGFVKDEDLPKYYAACDVYATCSHWEGFNLPAAEAQACGKPVVAFDLGSHPEVVKTGMLIREGDLEGFADAMVRLATK